MRKTLIPLFALAVAPQMISTAQANDMAETMVPNYTCSLIEADESVAATIIGNPLLLVARRIRVGENRYLFLVSNENGENIEASLSEDKPFGKTLISISRNISDFQSNPDVLSEQDENLGLSISCRKSNISL